MTVYVVGYCRFSSSNQREESIDAQMRAIEKYCHEKGYTLLRFYCDHARSGTTDKRPEFLRMVEDSAKQEFQFVIVHKLDRFSRDKYDSTIYKGKLKKNGVKVDSVLENLDGSPESMLMESLLEGMSQYYSENLRRETLKGMAENALKALHNGGKPPLGLDWCKEEKRYTINPLEAEIVRDIFSKYLEGWGYQKLIQYLNARNLKTKWGREFGKTAIHGILRNEKYIGTYIFNRVQGRDYRGKRQDHLQKPDEEIIRVENAIPPIIEKADFLKAQEMLKRNKKLSGKYKVKENNVYLLSGRVFCGECGAPLHGNSRIAGRRKEKYCTYRCSSRSKNKMACENREIRSDYLDKFVLQEINRLMLNTRKKGWLLKRIEKYADDRSQQKTNQMKELTAALSGVKEKIARMIALVQAGCDVDSVTHEIKKLEETRVDLETRLANCKYSGIAGLTVDKVERVIEMFEESVSSGDAKAFKQLIPLFLEKVELFRDRVEVVLKLDMSKKSLERNSVIPIGKSLNSDILERYRHAA